MTNGNLRTKRNLLHSPDPIGVAQTIKQKTMKLNLIINCAFCIVNCALLISCASNRPIATVHHERIETQMQAVPIGADTIEITLSRDAACCVRSPQRSKNNVTSVEIQRALLTKSNSESSNPNGKKSFQSVNQRSLSLWREKSVGNINSAWHAKRNSVHSVSSVRNKNSVRISSTRGVNIERIETDSSRTLRMTLRPDTVFVPYTNHIRSDTIVVPDRICNEKLKQSKFMNIILLIFLTLFVATIIYRKIFHK